MQVKHLSIPGVNNKLDTSVRDAECYDTHTYVCFCRGLKQQLARGLPGYELDFWTENGIQDFKGHGTLVVLSLQTYACSTADMRRCN